MGYLKLTNQNMSKKAFTLLELIIVIIIIGVLASLALPRFAALVTQTYKVEAFNNLTALRFEMEKCLVMTTFDACACMNQINGGTFRTGLNTSPGAKFDYVVSRCGTDIDRIHFEYTLEATYKPVPVPLSQVILYVNNHAPPYGILRCGNGIWEDLGTYSGGVCL